MFSKYVHPHVLEALGFVEDDDEKCCRLSVPVLG